MKRRVGTLAGTVARVRAGLLQAGWVPCAMRGCDKLTAPMEGERGPIYCALHDQRKQILKRGA